MQAQKSDPDAAISALEYEYQLLVIVRISIRGAITVSRYNRCDENFFSLSLEVQLNPFLFRWPKLKNLACLVLLIFLQF